MSRLDNDSSFAEACKTECEARNAAIQSAVELCRVGSLLAEGKPIDEIVFVAVPKEIEFFLADEWGDRIAQTANEEVIKAKTANKHLRDLGQGLITREAAEWLLEHWRNDLRWKDADNERHKREILLPHYASGPKYEKRLQRIADDTPEIERLQRRIAWAEDQCKS